MPVSKNNKSVFDVFLQIAFCILFLAVLILIGLVAQFQTILDDWRLGAIKRPPAQNIVFVEIDAKSIDAVGIWPWKRSIYGSLILALQDLNAEEITFDIDFSSPSIAEQDELFAEALKQAKIPISLAAFQRNKDWERTTQSTKAVLPLVQFADNAWTGSVNVFQDASGITRYGQYGFMKDNSYFPSFATLLSSTSSNRQELFEIDYSIDANQIKRYSFTDVLAGIVPTEEFEGKSVMVGASAVELGDIFTVPTYSLLPGSMVQILAAETLLQERALAHVDGLVVYAWLLFAQVISALALIYLSLPAIFIFTVVQILGIEFAAAHFFDTQALMLPDATWTLMSVLILGMAFRDQMGLHKLIAFRNNLMRENSERLLGRVVADSFDGVIVFDNDNQIVKSSHNAAKIMSQIADSDQIENSLSNLVEKIASMASEINVLNNDDAEIQRIQAKDHHGNDVHLDMVMTLSKVDDPDNPKNNASYKTLTFRDVTAEHLAKSRLEYQAHHDEVTGALNLNGLRLELNEMLATGAHVSIVRFNINRFKLFSQTLGQNRGNIFLKKIAQAFQNLKSHHIPIAFVGADEFIAAKNISVDNSGDISLPFLISDVLADGFSFGEEHFSLSASMGLASSINQFGRICDVERLIEMTNAAFDHASTLGIGSIVEFDPEVEKNLKLRQRLELEFPRALDENQFSVLYQPQIKLDTKTVVGVEALVRWDHPELGRISPLDFISIAEQCGFIQRLGAFVLGQACSDIVRLPQAITLAVNVSPYQLSNENFVDQVLDSLNITKFPPERLEIEITESDEITENTFATQALGELRKHQVQLAIDDFGTGYSSLAQLAKMPFTKIKIDKSLIDDLATSEKSVSMIETCILLARNMQVSILAEGIETVEQHNALLKMGCDYGQGYLHSRPITFEELQQFVAEEPIKKIA